MKRLLIFTPGYPPARNYGGPPVSISNLTEAIGGECDAYIVTSDHELKKSARLDGISDGWNKLGSASVLYLPDREMTRSRFCEIIDELKPDCIYLNAVFHALTTPAVVQIARRKKIRCVLAVRGGFCDNALKISSLKKRVYIKILRLIAGKNVVFHSTSDEETAAVRRLFRGCKVVQVSNLPKTGCMQDLRRTPKSPGELRMIFVSRIHPIKNLDFILRVLNNVNAKILFDIYGPIEDNEYWETCRKTILTLKDNVTVEYKGFLERNELDKTYANYDLFVLPTLTENFGHAIAEALSAGCVVLISDNTPWTDINGCRAGRAVPLDNPQGYADYIEQLAAMSENELSDLKSDIPAYLDRHFDLEQMKNIYLSMLFRN